MHDAAPSQPGPSAATLNADESTANSSWLARHGVSSVMALLFFAGLIYFLFKVENPAEKLIIVLKVGLGLGFVIFIHELGHFLAAKWCDVYVETFSIGFGPPFLGICAFKKGETTYKIAWFPLGGFVKMLGEGDESEGAEDDPRSFKNKPVWQRMIIISAGVVMNLILGALFFVFVYMTHGVKRPPAVVGYTSPGTPAWELGIPPACEITQIGSRVNPSMEDVMMVVMLSQKDSVIPLTYETRENGVAVQHHLNITPIRTEDSTKPIIGVVHLPYTTQLRKPTRLMKMPYREKTQASRASAPLQFGDRIIGATDPDNPTRVTTLANSPRHPDRDEPDYFDLHRRFQRLAGRGITLRIQRFQSGSIEEVSLPPSFFQKVGMRFRMGEVVAVRQESEAARVGVRTHTDTSAGDIISRIEVVAPDGSTLRFATNPDLAKGERLLDPARLPRDLSLWAASKPSSREVKVTVLRPEGHKGQVPHVLTMTWDSAWDWIDDTPSQPSAPLQLAGLGLAYKVQAVVDSVEPGSPAVASDLPAPIKAGDVISGLAVKFTFDGKPQKEEMEIKEDQGAYLAAILQQEHIEEVTLTVNKTEKVTLKPVTDPTWPVSSPGLEFEYEIRLKKAEGLGEALSMGLEKTFDTIFSIYRSLSAMVTGRVSPKNMYGPVSIAAASYTIAGENIYEFILFLALININLAVVNFLPIPVLDGGHMVFLIYEKLRGKPPSDQVRVIATFIGLGIVISLMIFGLWVDAKRFLF